MSQTSDLDTSSYIIRKFHGHAVLEHPDFSAMIFSDFLKCLRYHNPWFRFIDKDAYFEHYHPYIESLLRRPKVRVKIAVLTHDPDNCLGWIMRESSTVHFIYVPKDFRRLGIATALLDNDPFHTITHFTMTGLALWKKKFSHAKFNPFA